MATGESHQAIGSIISDIHYLLISHPDWTISFARRESNIVAHALATLASTLLTEMFVDGNGLDGSIP